MAHTGQGRTGAGMATYRLGFYGFDTLVLTGGEGHGASHPVATPGTRLQLSGVEVDLTPALVTLAGDSATAGPASAASARLGTADDVGSEWLAMDIPCLLSLVGEDTTLPHLSGAVLNFGGVPAGLLTAAPLQSGVSYRVAEVTAVEPGADIGAVLGAFDATPATQALAPVAETVFCFTAGTRVDTPEGSRLIEDLSPGDLVTTLGNGSQPLRWIGTRPVSVAEMLRMPEIRPVEFAVGVIGNRCALRVSPQHRVLLNDWRAQVYFGEDEVLIPAKAMINGRTIRQVLPAEGVTYVHLLFDRHEIIVADGALSESFHPGETGLQALDEAQRREVERLFPGMELAYRRAAFPIVKLTEARAIRLPD